jgi:uncharacterized protein YaiE (UPF0345 family)
MRNFLLAATCCVALGANAQTYVQLNPSAAQAGSTNITGTHVATSFWGNQVTTSGGNVHFSLTNGAVARWGVGMMGAENGTNLVGSDFTVFGYNNTGTFLGAPLYIQRSTGFTGLGFGTGAIAPVSLLQLRMPANGASTAYSTLTFGYASDNGNVNAPLGGVTGGYNIDFSTWRDIAPNQIGARIRAERLNSYGANNALIQSMELAFSTSTGLGASSLTERMRLTAGGYMGINTTNPQGALQVLAPAGGSDTRTGLYLTNNATDYGRTNLVLTGRLEAGNDAWNFGSQGRNSIVFATNTATTGAGIGATGTEEYSVQLEGNSKSLGFMSTTNGNTPNLVMTQSGYIGIGTANPQSLLAVKGVVTCQQVTVTQTGWSDFVFAPAYHLPSLDSVASYAARYHHLPGIPSETELNKSGLDLGAMQKLQMQKIEELTLYQASAGQKIEALQKENNDLKAELAELKAAVQRLEAAKN